MLKQKRSSFFGGALCAIHGVRAPLTKEEVKRKRAIYPSPRGAVLSVASYTTHSSILVARAPSLSVPSAITLPTPTAPGTLQTAAPTWDWLTKPGHLRGPPLLASLLWPLEVFHSCSGVRRGSTSSWPGSDRTSTCLPPSCGSA
jgi:hypothetical protein